MKETVLGMHGNRLPAEAMSNTSPQASATLASTPDSLVSSRLMHHVVSDGPCASCSLLPSPAAAGDYICEYIGHVVRPVVADRLEAHTYNQLVGAGAG